MTKRKKSWAVLGERYSWEWNSSCKAFQKHLIYSLSYLFFAYRLVPPEVTLHKCRILLVSCFVCCHHCVRHIENAEGILTVRMKSLGNPKHRGGIQMRQSSMQKRRRGDQKARRGRIGYQGRRGLKSQMDKSNDRLWFEWGKPAPDSCCQPPHACRNFCGDLTLTMKQEVRERYESICSHEIFRLESQTRGSLDSSDKVQIPIWTWGLVLSTDPNTIYCSSSPIDLAFACKHWPQWYSQHTFR